MPTWYLFDQPNPKFKKLRKAWERHYLSLGMSTMRASHFAEKKARKGSAP